MNNLSMLILLLLHKLREIITFMLTMLSLLSYNNVSETRKANKNAEKSVSRLFYHNKLTKSIKEEARKAVNTEKIREKMKQLGIKQKELAAAVGVSEAMITNILKGFKEPSIKVAKRIATELGCTLDEITI